MKSIFFAMLSLSTFVSCGKFEPTIPHEFDEWFTPHLEHFKQDADAENISYGALDSVTVFKFGDPKRDGENNTIASCTYNIKSSYDTEAKKELETDLGFSLMGIEYHLLYKEIIFSEQIKSYPVKLQYQLFLHEIGHCVYNLHHSNPGEIMQPSAYSFSDSNFSAAKERYFQSARDNQANWFSENSPN